MTRKLYKNDFKIKRFKTTQNKMLYPLSKVDETKRIQT